MLEVLLARDPNYSAILAGFLVLDPAVHSLAGPIQTSQRAPRLPCQYLLGLGPRLGGLLPVGDAA